MKQKYYNSYDQRIWDKEFLETEYLVDDRITQLSVDCYYPKVGGDKLSEVTNNNPVLRQTNMKEKCKEEKREKPNLFFSEFACLR